MHTFKMQVVNDSNGGQSADYEVGDWRDTVSTPMAGWVDVRFVPGTFQGLVPAHCHMLIHADRGMSAVAQVADVCPSPSSERVRAGAGQPALSGGTNATKTTTSFGAPPPWTPPLSNFSFPITTRSPQAQALFNEGIQLAFGFARDAAASFFNASLQADSTCAMCAWGLGYVSGPFINHATCNDARCGSGADYAALASKLAAQQQLTAKEALLIAALSKRYSPSADANMTANFRAYAVALNNSALLSSDADLAAFFAEAVMILYCTSDGYNFYNAATGLAWPEVAQATQVLEHVLLQPGPSRTLLPPPRQPFAEHLYVHITEPSTPGYGPNSAGRSDAVADDLRQRYNTSSSLWQHLQHMPAHEYLRTGRYGDAVQANILAHSSDAQWLAKGVVPYGPGHNLVFLIYAACMDGQRGVAESYGPVLQQIYSAAPGMKQGGVWE